ncbi:hypothetical protein BV20DRAFT_909194, partial [Pilatotrama ljubarskyi]
LTHLRTGHAPLNDHLHRIGRADSPLCPACMTARETVIHHLIQCPACRRQRALLPGAALSLGKTSHDVLLTYVRPAAR